MSTILEIDFVQRNVEIMKVMNLSAKVKPINSKGPSLRIVVSISMSGHTVP